MMMSFKQSKLSSAVQVLYYKSSKTSNLPANTLLFAKTQIRFFAIAQTPPSNSQMSVSERLRLMVERQEDMAARVRTTKQTQGIAAKKASGVAHPTDD